MAPPYETKAVQGLSPGAVAEVLLGRYNDLEYTGDLIRRHRNDLAAVIVEPMMGAGGGIVAEAEFLQGLRAVTQECGVLLVLDEIITFRLGYGGAQERYGIKPDLTCFGKIIGGGLPIGAFGGRSDIMATFDPTRPGAIVHSGTYNGNAATMAAGIATLELLTREAIADLNRRGDGLRQRLQAKLDAAGIEAVMTGTGSLMQLHFAPGPLRNAGEAARAAQEPLRAMHLSLTNRGVFSPSRQMYVVSTAVTDALVDTVVDQFEAALAPIAEALRARQPVGAGR
jgi:glutamate-1-semialdehyde 2,1-aminomutase